MKRICLVVGARPNFMKAAPIIKEIKRRNNFECILIHTNQHYDEDLSDFFFKDLDLPNPIILENISTGGMKQIADITIALEAKFKELKPDLIIVVGDVNSTYAAAFVANRLGIPVAHVEAGLRSFDRTMTEEINRILVDALSDYHFVTEISGKENLLREGVGAEKIHFVGNTMIDTLLACKDIALKQSKILNKLGLDDNGYAILTLHRPANVDDMKILEKLFQAIFEIQKKIKVVFPIHPRTRKRLNNNFLNFKNLIMVDPLGYLDFLKLMMNSRMILTDSGGIQEEATVLRVPCLTLRENTERPSTIEAGGNKLVGRNPEKIVNSAKEISNSTSADIKTPFLWDGKAAERIVNILEQNLIN